MKLSNEVKSLFEQEDKSSTDGEVAHYHLIKRDKDGVPISHGPENEGPKHAHPIVDLDPGYKLGPAGDTDKDDPDHEHKIK